MRLKEMVLAYLTKWEFDGLFNASSGCGCEKGDLFPCQYPNGNCKAGYYKKCPMNDECDCGRFHIGEKKEKK